MTPEIPDQELVRRFLETEDARCFKELTERHRERIYWKCYGFFLDHGRAEDMTQETLLRAYSNLKQFEDGSFEGWLLKIAKHACIDQLRKLRMETELGESAMTVPSSEKSPEQQLELVLAAERLHKEMKDLSPDQRRCLEMKAEGYSYQQTAASTGLTVEAVKSHLQNGRRILRLKMKGVLSWLK